MLHYEVELSRFEVVKGLITDAFGLNLGCGNTRYKNKINLDVSRKRRGIKNDVEIIASASNLSFQDNSFEEIIFSEVLEHIPEKFVCNSIREIHRIMKVGGRLILTVPNGGLGNKLTDPSWWLGESPPYRKFGKNDNRHRHYSKKEVLKLFSEFKVVKMFTSGRLPWGSQSIWTINRITGTDFCVEQIKSAFRGSIGNKGSVLFAVLGKKE